MRRGRETQQRNRLPKRMHKGNEHYRRSTKRTDQHGKSSAHPDRVPTANIEARQPAAGNAADSGPDIHDDERWTEVPHVYMKALIEILGQPEEIKPPDGIGGPLG